MKAPWGIINRVIKSKIFDEFNRYFVDIGPRLAANKPKTIKDNEKLIMNNVNSIFLGKVEKEETLNIVKGC